jgi:hypothetical protein
MIFKSIYFTFAGTIFGFLSLLVRTQNISEFATSLQVHEWFDIAGDFII